MKIEITPKELIDFMQQIQNQRIVLTPETMRAEDIAVPLYKENGYAVGTLNQNGGTAK